MQYRLSTIFLVFFVVATSMALFGAAGIWISTVLCVAALLFNKARTVEGGVFWIIVVVLVGIVCPGYLALEGSASRNFIRRIECTNNLKQIGFALQNYHKVHGHFPMVSACDKEGTPLFSWLVEILPDVVDGKPISDQLKQDEPWHSPHNAKILETLRIPQFVCPGVFQKESDFSSSYAAIIGPGTIWRKEGPVAIKDLAKPSAIVAAVECVTSDKHWAEPYAITVDEALERMKTGKEMRISTAHQSVVNVLFADGHTEAILIDLPISQWRKLLMGEVKSTDELTYESSGPDDPLPVQMSVFKPEPNLGEWPYLFSILVWVISVIMLFYRAWDSRKFSAAKKNLNEPHL
jgi:prepilin-type processing-associated H-X9-DG protein